jgi:ParB-like chromosome segregation protein Spo0J
MANKPKLTMTFRNPLLYARELQDRMWAENINHNGLARRLGVSRARVTQWLDLLDLPEEVLHRAEAMGDNWEHRLVTERILRRSR